MSDRYCRPRLSLAAARLFYAIVQYVRRHRNLYVKRPQFLRSAPSDVMDGWKWPNDPEVEELVRKGILEERQVSSWRGSCCGICSTWELTPLGCRLVKGLGEERSSADLDPAQEKGRK